MSVITQLTTYETNFNEAKSTLSSACTVLKEKELAYETALANYECCIETNGDTGCEVPNLGCTGEYQDLQDAKIALASTKTAFYNARSAYFVARDALVCYAKSTIKDLCKEDFSCN